MQIQYIIVHRYGYEASWKDLEREELRSLTNVHPDYKIDELAMGPAVPTVQIAHDALEKCV